MRTEVDRLQHSVTPTNGNIKVEMPQELIINDTHVLEEEIERLRQRVEDLDLTIVEYRNQMTQIVTSTSWKSTKPIRSGAAQLLADPIQLHTATMSDAPSS